MKGGGGGDANYFPFSVQKSEGKEEQFVRHPDDICIVQQGENVWGKRKQKSARKPCTECASLLIFLFSDVTILYS